jgi:hypothetical protein
MPDFSQSLFMLGRWLLNLVLIVVVIVIVIRYWRQIVIGFQQLWASWRHFWEALLGRKTPVGEEAAIEQTAAPRLAWADFSNPFTVRVRGVNTTEQALVYSFRALEAWAADHNCPRQPHETPWEFGERLAASHAALANVTSDLTTLYARLNYGQGQLPANGMASLRAFWERLENYALLTREAPVAATGASIAAK